MAEPPSPDAPTSPLVSPEAATLHSAPAAGQAAPADQDPDAPTLRIPVRVELPPEEPHAAAAGPARTEGRYRVEDEIGRGGMGVVHRAFDRDLRRDVAMKVLIGDLDGDPDLVARFIEEAQATAQLQHPGIVPVYEIGRTVSPEGEAPSPGGAGRLYFTMKLVHGRTLARVVELARSGDADAAKEFTLFRLLQIFVEIARTVSYAHDRGVVHRDLKPQNVMLGGHGEVQVMDWGLAKVLARGAPARAVAPAAERPARAAAAPAPRAIDTASGRHDTLAGTIAGTPAYMPPEQAEGRLADIGPASDVYALGAMLFHVLTGRPPFESPSAIELVSKVVAGEFPRPRAVDPGVARELDAICVKAMAKDPKARYPSAKALADDVQAWLEGRPVSAYPEGLLPRLVKAARRHLAVTATAAAALVLVFLGSLVALVLIEGERRHAVGAERLAAERAREAETQRARAEAREREVTLGLGRIFLERAGRALAAHDVRPAEVLLAKALTIDDRREARERLLEVRAKGARLVWTSGPGAEAWTVAFSPDPGLAARAARDPGARRRLAAGGADGAIRIRDARTGEEVAVLRGHEGEVADLSYGPDGARLVSASFDGTVRVWDASAARELWASAGGHGHAWSAGFSPDGRAVAAGFEDGLVQILDAATGKPLRELRGHARDVTAVVFSPDGRRLATASWDLTARVWDPERGVEVLTFAGHENWVHTVAFSPDPGLAAGAARDPGARRRIASAGDDQAVRIWDAATGEEVKVLRGHRASVDQAAFSEDGRWLASAGGDWTVRVWDLGLDREAVVLRSERTWTENGIVFGPGGLLAAASIDGAVQVWEFDRSDEVQVLRGHDGDVWGLDWGPDPGLAAGAARDPGARERLASAAQDGTVRIWDIGTGKEAVAIRHDGPVADAAFSPDGRRIASAAADGTVRIFDSATGATLAALRGHEEHVDNVDFSPDGARLASASGDGTARVWDLASGKDLLTLRHDAPVANARFSPDGRRIATAARTVHLWDAASGREIATLSGHERDVFYVTFSPDGRLLASASWDQTVRVWDAATLEPLRTLRGHEDWVYNAQFSADGRRLASASRDGTLRIWDVATGAQLIALRGHGGEVIGLAFHPDGRRVAAAGFDRAIRVWSLPAVERVMSAPPAELLEEAERHTGLRVDGLDLVPVGEQAPAPPGQSAPTRGR